MKTPFLYRQGKPNTMLIVDDDEMNCDILTSIFDEQHKVVTAHNGLVALDELSRHGNEVCAILLDVQMPEMDGLSMLEKLAENELPDQIPVFLITGETRYEKIKRAYELGVMDVISKPFAPAIVEKRVHSVMELFAARNHFKEVVDQQTEELREQNTKLKDLNAGMIEALATATEFRSGESGEHVRRIHDITRMFLMESPLHELYEQEEIDHISNASILHDVGKISIPDAILNKPGKFTDEEFIIMKEHTINGDKLLTQIEQLRDLPYYEYAKTIARNHHERWDGKGYPDKLQGNDIPLCAQIVSIADVYDALVSTRVYKPPFTHVQTVKMICDGQCGAFNPLLLEYFKMIEPKIKQLYQQKGALASGVDKNGCAEKS